MVKKFETKECIKKMQAILANDEVIGGGKRIFEKRLLVGKCNIELKLYRNKEMGIGIKLDKPAKVTCAVIGTIIPPAMAPVMAEFPPDLRISS